MTAAGLLAPPTSICAGATNATAQQGAPQESQTAHSDSNVLQPPPAKRQALTRVKQHAKPVANRVKPSNHASANRQKKGWQGAQHKIQNSTLLHQDAAQADHSPAQPQSLPGIKGRPSSSPGGQQKNISRAQRVPIATEVTCLRRHCPLCLTELECL